MEETPENVPLINHCPECGKALDVGGIAPFSKIECPGCGAPVRVRTTMGQYEIVGLLGEGGMSQVFRATDRNLGREVALKILHQSLSSDSALTAMFEREAKLTASIVHPNVVKVYTVGQDHSYFFIAMEVLNATSLEQLIANKGALSESEVLGIALDVANGLKAAYDEDLIHRDIKPGNMLVTDDGMTKLVDFGLAVQQGGADESEDLWATPFYVPPEKLDGAPDTFHGDIYSLGATLFHALAGKPPFEANTSSMEELKEIKKNVVDLKSVAPGLSKNTVKLVEKMMAYAPADRHQTYEEVISQIEEVRKRQFGVMPVGKSRRRGKKKRVLAAVVLLFLIASIVSLVLYMNRDAAVEEAGLGIAGGERVISDGENTITGQFLAAREQLASGDYRSAEKIFLELVKTGAVPASTRIWSHYFLGLIQLFTGEEVLSRESFAYVRELTPESSESNAAAIASLKKIATGLDGTLPLLEDEIQFTPDSMEVLALLSAGLKNWQLGELQSAMLHWKAFSERSAPSEFPWIERLKERIEPFRNDFALLEKLPNPSAGNSPEQLEKEAAELTGAIETLKTRGASVHLVRSRLKRIDDIRDLAAAPPKTLPVEDTPTVPAVVASTGEPVAPVSPPSGNSNPADPAALAEISRLVEFTATLKPFSETYLFSGAVVKLEAETFATSEASAIRGDLVYAYQQAGTFLQAFAEVLASRSYEGAVRRRAGVSLEATVTAVDATALILDLGFGPNEVEIEAFAPDWLVETAITIYPPVTSETSVLWKKLIFFATVTGSADLVQAKAAEVAAVDPEFAQRFERLSRLR
jgi:hypothetical protein